MNKPLIYTILGLFIIIGIFIVSNNEKKQIPSEKPKLRNIDKTDYYIGHFQPAEIVKIASEIPGVVDSVFVKNGDYVETGSPVAQVEIIQNPNSLESARRTTRITKTDLAQKKLDHDRNNTLFQKGVIARKDYEVTKLALEFAQIENKAALNNLQIAQKGYTGNNNNAPNFVKSTINGRVLQVLVQKGKNVTERNTFNDGTTIAIIVNSDKYFFNFKITELDINRLQVNTKFGIVVKALDNQIINARIEEIIPSIKDDESVEYTVKAVITENLKSIQPGFSGLAEFTTSSTKNALSIKEKNIIYRGRKSYVETLINEDGTKETEIVTGVSDGIFTEIISGISIKDKIKAQ